MKKSKFKDSEIKIVIEELVKQTDHKTLAVWAADCAERVLHYFEEKFPDDDRPRKAIEGCREWVSTGIFKMAVVRELSLASHAAARECEEDSPARFAARAAGQAMATPHVYTHSLGPAWYAAKVVWADDPANAEVNVEKEREWQYKHLLELSNLYK